MLDYYLPDGLRYATLTGPVPDVGVTDWRDGVERLRATSAERDLAPLLDALEPGGGVALVVPHDLRARALERAVDASWCGCARRSGCSTSPTTRASGSPRSSRPTPFPASPNPVRARVYLKR